MPLDHRARLAAITRFDELIPYLRDEMGWPITARSLEDADDLFYDFTADELGIEPKTAAKIETIRRLRPLTAQQPWGIFFVKFEPKRLPVVALRRILNRVASKERGSGNQSQQAKWATDDLLFVSSYGEDEHRQISFAHFSEATAGRPLPSLKVLGWDNLDTSLRLDEVAKELTGRLAWPENETEINAWKRQWTAAFTLRHREVITTSRDLSVRLAQLARVIRERISAALPIESETGPLTRLMSAFRKALLHDLDADGFADMYAQTIAYGLLSARIADPHRNTTDDFAAHMRTNPLLGELMESFLGTANPHETPGRPGIDFDELGISEIVELLDDARMEDVLRDFGDRNPQEDPVIHFYELFLKEYDSKKRMQRGVFYTPRPVVSYIVSSVDELLRTELGLADGLADTTTWSEMASRPIGPVEIPAGISPSQPFVQILDPATGTGTFLVEVIDLIHLKLVAKWKEQGYTGDEIANRWNAYVPKHLLPRLHGFELLMAPYAIAHLKIGLKLYETGYRFASEERVRVFLTNALEQAHDFSARLEIGIPALAHEAQAVNDVKLHQRFSVVVGNPPYSGVSSNMSPYAQQLVEPYKLVDGQPLGERKVWLQDDYVKFFRLAELSIVRTGAGVLGYISNHSYLDNPTFRGMRQSLMQTFQHLRVLDLHGNTNRQEAPPIADSNVFDIQQGVAVMLGARSGSARGVEHGELWGTRAAKYEWLLSHASGVAPNKTLSPDQPYYFLVPRDESFRSEYQGYLSLPDAFNLSVSGIVTSRDGFVIALDSEDLKARILDYVDPLRSDDEIRDSYGLSENYAWRLDQSREALMADGYEPLRIKAISYRPFDTRQIYYHPAVVWRTRPVVMRHMLESANVALVVTRQSGADGWRHVLAARGLVESSYVSNRSREIGYVLPLYVSPGSATLFDKERVANLSEAILTRLSTTLGGAAANPSRVGPEEVFNYIYAVLHSQGYRERYSEFLRVDFPRLPLAKNADLFVSLAGLGRELVALHLLESTTLKSVSTTYFGPMEPTVGRVAWSNETVWLDAGPRSGERPDTAGTMGFHGVDEATWHHEIGAYRVCEKWLKDRKGRTLSEGDRAHFASIVVAISETIRITKEIDTLIDSYGGWPAAFATEPTVLAEVTQVVATDVEDLPRAAEEPGPYQSTAQRDDA
jgi:hypothetical protein